MTHADEGASTADTVPITAPPSAAAPRRGGTPDQAGDGTTAPAVFDGDATASAATASAAGAAPAASDPAFPVSAQDRYECLGFLGEGGMGRVFLARDLRLGREVAIKFVRGDDPKHTARLLSEARAQARVNDERVCKVHEVGELDGQIYISMQYIDGQPLSALAEELGAEQKALTIRDAALGIHEAHRAGIIHRDIKPANIMVERRDGRLLTHVMDFGLARDWMEGQTETGTVMGTPHYMAPEQARGEVARLDRRADVYSLGASLYWLLTGAPAIEGSNALQVLNHIASREPRRPREVDPDIPADLEAIVLKCLEKDRSLRYDSARALAEDLDRFLAGEPVLARRADLWYRVGKRLRKHARSVAIGASLLVIVLCALGFGLQARLQAAERERLARRFTEMVERIEAKARYSALARSHDIRGDRSEIRARMEELRAEIATAGPVAAGAGNYALGRGYLALGDEAKAREALQGAWGAGFREPRAAYALALVMGRLYQRQLLEAERIPSEERREAKKREIEREYRDPALAYLQQSEGADVPSKEYVSALLAFHEGRLDEALARLDAVGTGLPWFYEAAELRGRVLLARATAAYRRGDRKGALADFDAGRAAYAAAAATAESVPDVWEAAAALEYQAMVMELYGGGDVQPPFVRGVAATQRALAALPDHHAALVLLSRLHRSMAEYSNNRGGKVDDLLSSAISAAQRASAASPESATAKLELARAHRQWGEYLQAHGEDPSKELALAIEVSETIRPEDRSDDFHGNLGLVYMVWADYEDAAGRDSGAHRAKAIEVLSEVVARDPRAVDAWINLAVNHLVRASTPKPADADGDIARAISALDKALSINPRHVVARLYEGTGHGLLALRKRSRGDDPALDLAAALDHYQRGLEIAPDDPNLQNGAGTIFFHQAREAWDRGADPNRLLDHAKSAFEKAITLAPDQPSAHSNVGEALLWRASFAFARGEDPSADANAAVAAVGEALKRTPDSATFWQNSARAQSLLAQHALDHGRDPEKFVKAAITALDKALLLNPKETGAHACLGEALGVRARFRASRNEGRAEDFDLAAQAFRRGLELAPDDQDGSVDLGRFYGAWASWSKSAGLDAERPLAEGLKIADGLLAARPAWPDALALRGSLHLLRAQLSTVATERQERAALASKDLSAALAANSNLERKWRASAALAQQIATAAR